MSRVSREEVEHQIGYQCISLAHLRLARILINNALGGSFRDRCCKMVCLNLHRRGLVKSLARVSKDALDLLFEWSQRLERCLAEILAHSDGIVPTSNYCDSDESPSLEPEYWVPFAMSSEMIAALCRVCKPRSVFFCRRSKERTTQYPHYQWTLASAELEALTMPMSDYKTALRYNRKSKRGDRVVNPLRNLKELHLNVPAFFSENSFGSGVFGGLRYGLLHLTLNLHDQWLSWAIFKGLMDSMCATTLRRLDLCVWSCAPMRCFSNSTSYPDPRFASLESVILEVCDQTCDAGGLLVCVLISCSVQLRELRFAGVVRSYGEAISQRVRELVNLEVIDFAYSTSQPASRRRPLGDAPDACGIPRDKPSPIRLVSSPGNGHSLRVRLYQILCLDRVQELGWYYDRPLNHLDEFTSLQRLEVQDKFFVSNERDRLLASKIISGLKCLVLRRENSYLEFPVLDCFSDMFPSLESIIWTERDAPPIGESQTISAPSLNRLFVCGPCIASCLCVIYAFVSGRTQLRFIHLELDVEWDSDTFDYSAIDAFVETMNSRDIGFIVSASGFGNPTLFSSAVPTDSLRLSTRDEQC